MKNLYLIFFIIFIVSCPYWSDSNNPKIQDYPLNMVNLNTQYDDYNSMAPPPENTDIKFIYSTNRFSAGEIYRVGRGNFNLSWEDSSSIFGEQEGQLLVKDEFEGRYDFPCSVTNAGNIFGPAVYSDALPYKFIPYPYKYKDELPPKIAEVTYNEDNFIDIDSKYLVYFYTTETTSGDYDIYYCTRNNPESKRVFFDSNDNEKYITISDNGVIYFSSDRNGKYNIYSLEMTKNADKYGAEVSGELSLSYWLDNFADNIEPKLVEELSDKTADDTCPYAVNDVLVFVSNRLGGQGGYDILKSSFDYSQQKWRKPMILPYPINTKANEFRPSIYNLYGYNNSLMFFSSDRKGGKGGYDLYYTGIDFYYYK